MAQIFLCYRRIDQDLTGRVYDRLTGRFGEESVFKDVDNIPVGVDFRKALAEAIKAVTFCWSSLEQVGPQ
jgi:hypothetical protein